MKDLERIQRGERDEGEYDEIEGQLQEELRENKWKKDSYIKIRDDLYRIKGKLIQLSLENERIMVKSLRNDEGVRGQGFLEKVPLRDFLFN